MITTKMYKSLLSSQGANLGDIKKEQSDRNINTTFTSTPEYKRIYILTKDGWKWEDAKFFRHTKQSISSDAADSYLQFRPKVHYPIGSYVLIPDDTSPQLNLTSTELLNPFKQPVDNRTQWWILVNRNDTNYPVYNILKCNWNFKWVYDGKVQECFGCVKYSSSYTSGVWTDEYSTQLDSQGSMWLPDLYYAYGEKIKEFGIDDNRTITHGVRFFVTTNLINPDLYKVTKILTAIPKGVIKITLKEDDLDRTRDNIELMIADYYNSSGQTNVDTETKDVIPDVQHTSQIYSMSISSLGVLEIDHATDVNIPEIIGLGKTSYFNVHFSDMNTEARWTLELITDVSNRDKSAAYYENLIKITDFDDNTISVKPGKASSIKGLQYKLIVSDENGDYKSYAVLEVES